MTTTVAAGSSASVAMNLTTSESGSAASSSITNTFIGNSSTVGVVPSSSSTSSLAVGGSLPPSASSKLVLVPKDFSLQRAAAAAAAAAVSSAPNTSAQLVQMANTTVTSIPVVTFGSGSANVSNGKRPLEQNGGSGGGSPVKSIIGNGTSAGSTSAAAILKTVNSGSGDTTPNKRNRVSGIVTGVSEIILAHQASASQQQQLQLQQQQQQQQLNNGASNPQHQNQHSSKFVSGGFDLEEHIRALPQLADTHLINALHMRNAHDGGVSGAGKGALATATTGLVMVSQAPPTSVITTSALQQQQLKNSTALHFGKSGTPTTTLLHLQHTNSPSPPTNALNQQQQQQHIPLHHLSVSESSQATSLPLRLVTTTSTATNGGQQRTMQVSPSSVLIKLAPGQTIAGANVVLANTGSLTGAAGATVQTVDGSLLPLIIRGQQPQQQQQQLNKPVDLSMAIGEQHHQLSHHQLSQLTALRNGQLTTQAYLSPTTLTLSGAQLSAAVSAAGQAGTHLTIVTSSANHLQPHHQNIVTSLGGLQQHHQSSQSPVGSVSRTQSPSSGQSSSSNSIFSTVISSQGSINQCDGLAALAEIALAQRNIS